MTEDIYCTVCTMCVRVRVCVRGVDLYFSVWLQMCVWLWAEKRCRFRE